MSCLEDTNHTLSTSDEQIGQVATKRAYSPPMASVISLAHTFGVGSSNFTDNGPGYKVGS